MRLADSYDLIVVGGGPAGSFAACTAAESGLKTILLEKDRDFGIPVRCAEGVGLKGLMEFIESDPKWIDNKIDGVRFIAPDGTVLAINLVESGVVLNRKVFDFELARRAAEAGAVLYNRCYVNGLERGNGFIKVSFENFGSGRTVRAPIIIGADGIESRVGRWAGLKTSLPLHDVESCFQYVLHHPKIDVEYCDFYFGDKIAPGGYVWLFPKGEHYANVGLGIAGDRAKEHSAREYLDDFISHHFPGASYLGSVAGAVPSSRVVKKLTADGVMLAGDAAHQADPISGGGILTAMWGGKLAAQTAVKAHGKGDFSAGTLSEYTKAWNERIGKQHDRHYRLKKGIRRLSDDVLNRTAKIVLDLPFEQRTLRKVFQTALVNEPGLMVDIVKAFLY